MAFFTVSSESDESGSPFNVEFCGKFGIGQDLERNDVFRYECNDLCVGVRNCTHLLTPDSSGVEEVQKYRFPFRLSPGKSRFHGAFPFDSVSHRLPPGALSDRALFSSGFMVV